METKWIYMLLYVDNTEMECIFIPQRDMSLFYVIVYS